jgi:hypothetical protein
VSDSVPIFDPELDDRKLKIAIAAEDARRNFWSKVGRLEQDTPSGFIRPTGWPGYAGRYLAVRRRNTTILLSDGMSNPFEFPRNNALSLNGYGYEFFIETADIPKQFLGDDGDVALLTRSWAYAVLNAVCSTVASRGGISDDFKKFGLLSFDIPGVREDPRGDQIPGRFITADGSLGVLLGAPRPDFKTEIPDMPISPVLVIPVVLVNAEQTLRLRSNSTKIRRKIASELQSRGGGWISKF